MRNTGTLQVTLKSDREVVLKRIFDAPRRMVFEAMTKPELLKLVVSEIERRVGGKWRSVLRSPEGKEMGMSGVYREIEAPERIVSTEAYDDYPGAETLNTILLDEANGKTTFTCTILYPSKEVRDLVVGSGMEHGAAECYDRLAEFLLQPEPRSLERGA